ncbi:hypothetical protein CLOSTASPAR_04180 [[Clostridium] asparagiforme DSM 15981]|uniref:Uncharacterized protein n=1 Tax=[Clostridium] asparagiforme DSM 15981 TaxID=518636 RepID=C0D4I7_9FIRM|nr:hypothetical protein CLOSTASPAR_04180 [[Clostridium] asparagiforme DSM 15981]
MLIFMLFQVFVLTVLPPGIADARYKKAVFFSARFPPNLYHKCLYSVLL